ncbi:ABC transporter permease [Nakamurella endophytica]|uniref:Ribose ABC transporter permease n=1 Tax=Nakamurella endophytica TaxID=1748367 RepID=A0A917SZN6_9ACTN|nr:ABC transporter permease [Nakamurella endophytica]GGM05130.1 ribose ABC transporter permease [Nakamurella endophytica]
MSTPDLRKSDSTTSSPVPAPSPVDAPARTRAGTLVLGRLRALGGPLAGLILLVILLSVLSPYFLRAQNLSNIISQVSDIGIMAAGATLVILVGGIDLSVAAVLALTMMFSAWLFANVHLPWGLSMILGLAMGALIGLINGILTTYGRVQAFVATLATMSAASGFTLFITDGNTINGFPSWFDKFFNLKPGGIPLVGILLVVVYLVIGFWLKYRPGGRALYAIGGNEEVARLSGLPVKWSKTRVYMIAGALAAVAGWIDIAQLDSAAPTAGTGYLLNVIAVVVIGGASLAGGVGTMGGTFIGLLIIGVLNNGLSLLHVNSNLQPVVVGIVILAAVLSDRGGIRARGA